MIDRLQGVEQRFSEIELKLADPDIVRQRDVYQKYVMERAELEKVVTAFRSFKKIQKELEDSIELQRSSETEIRELAREEAEALVVKKEQAEQELKKLLMPGDPNDSKNVIIEIRAGTGGDEAALFAGDLYRMYSRYAETKNWKVEILNLHSTGGGGIKEIISMIHGNGAYSRLKFESGTHRVQRVPTTEAQGRIHTSAVTVAVLPEAEEVEIDIDPSELRIDVFRSTGPGGQHVNTTDSAVRITHLPSGLVVSCQDEKSQWKNKAKAMKVLRARLLDRKIQEQTDKRSEERKSQIGTGDRSGRIRTYNFPQGRMTDHRIGLTLYRLESILQGDIDEIIEELITHHQAQVLKNGHPPAPRKSPPMDSP